MDKLQSNMLKGIIVSAICLAPLPISAATPPTAKAAATVAQDDGKTVGGTVLDENGEPVIGATVTVKGTNLVTVTDIDGRFELKVPNGSILSVSYLGYTTAEVPATGENLTISLKPDERQLAEVVVTALGIRRSEKALSYNVQQVNSEQLTTVKSANFMNSLAKQGGGCQHQCLVGRCGRCDPCGDAWSEVHQPEQPSPLRRRWCAHQQPQQRRDGKHLLHPAG